MDWKGWAGAGGAGMAGAGLGAMFGDYKNPADAARGDMDQIPGQINKYFNPYIQNGMSQYGGLNNQYSQLMNDPGGRINQIGASYHQSPGFQFALQQGLQGAGHAAAAGGMAGSPQHEQQNMTVATGLADQDYNQYLQNALGAYGMGLSGSQGMYNIGAQMSGQAGEDMSSYFANRAKLNYEGQNADNQHQGGMWGNIAGAAATALPFMF